jgi:hypothetical protein
VCVCIYIYIYYRERERGMNVPPSLSSKSSILFIYGTKSAVEENHWADLLLSTQPIHCRKILFFSFLCPTFISRNFGLVVVIVDSNIIIQTMTHDSTANNTTIPKDKHSKKSTDHLCKPLLPSHPIPLSIEEEQ